MRDVELRFCEEAELRRRPSKSTVATICAELHERFGAFCRRSLYDVKLVVLFLDAIYPGPSERPEGGRDLRLGNHRNRRQRAGIGAVGSAGGQGGLGRARPRSHQPRARCPTVGRRRRRPGLDLGGRGDLAARRSSALCCASPAQSHSEAAEVRARPDPLNYWSALTDATSVKDGKLRLQVLISELEHRGYESAARCLAEDLDALVVHLRYPLRHRERWR